MSLSLAGSRFSLIETDVEEQWAAFATAVRHGLSQTPKTLPCHFLYDQEGSRLFEEICELPEYYLTRAERAILDARADEIVGGLPEGVILAELGSGNSAKTRLLIEALLRRRDALCYIPVDISREILEASSRALLARYPALEVRAIAAEYGEGLLAVHDEPGPKLILWLGSNVGNFERPAAQQFLAGVRAAMDPDDRLLVGIDLRKDAATLEAAYDDARGVTARFSLNLLQRVNDELGGKFDLESFEHRAVYEVDAGRVKIELVSRREQRVAIAYLDLEVPFAAGEGIHTESSYKYSVDEIDALAAGAGLRPRARWFDPERLFSLNLFSGSP